MRYVGAALGWVALLVLACGPSRPEPGSPKADWVEWCASRASTCELCAGEGSCGYCPETNACLHYSLEDESAAATCPGIVKNAPRCSQE